MRKGTSVGQALLLCAFRLVEAVLLIALVTPTFTSTQREREALAAVSRVASDANAARLRAVLQESNRTRRVANAGVAMLLVANTALLVRLWVRARRRCST